VHFLLLLILERGRLSSGQSSITTSSCIYSKASEILRR
jgi:hypothetical protein